MGRDCPSIRGSAATQGEGRRGTAEPVPSESEGPLLRMREWWSLFQRPLGRNLTGGAYPPGNVHPSPPQRKSSLITRSGFPARSKFDAAHSGNCIRRNGGSPPPEQRRSHRQERTRGFTPAEPKQNLPHSRSGSTRQLPAFNVMGDEAGGRILKGWREAEFPHPGKARPHLFRSGSNHR